MPRPALRQGIGSRHPLIRRRNCRQGGVAPGRGWASVRRSCLPAAIPHNRVSTKTPGAKENKMNLSARPSRRAIAITTATATALALAFCRRARHSPRHPRPSATTATTTRSRSSRSACRPTVSTSTWRHSRRSPTRTAATAPPVPPGYDASVDYVVETLDAAGWQVTLETFDYFTYVGPSELEQLDADRRAVRDGRLHRHRLRDESTGNVIPVDLVLDRQPAAVTSGCEAADFAGLDFSGDERHRARPARHLQVRRQGRSTRRPPARRPSIIMNQGNTPDRVGAHRRHHADRREPRRRSASPSSAPPSPPASRSRSRARRRACSCRSRRTSRRRTSSRSCPARTTTTS